MTRLSTSITRISIRSIPLSRSSFRHIGFCANFTTSTLNMSASESSNGVAKSSAFTRLSSTTGDGESKARLGELALKGRDTVETPNFLAVTSRGVMPHISPDSIPSQATFPGVFTAIEDFIEKAMKGANPPIMSCKASSPSTPFHEFTCLPTSLPIILAPRRTPAVTAPKGNPAEGLAVFTSVGFQPVSPVAYAKYANHFKSDVVIALGDNAYGPLPGRKRASKMAERTGIWVDTILNNLEKDESGATKAAVFAPVLPTEIGGQSHYLMHLDEEVAPKLAGLAFYDSEMLPEMQRWPKMDSLARLSLDEAPGPHDVLRQVDMGMDMFALPFITTATESGLALTFKFPVSDTQNEDVEMIEGTSVQPLAIDMANAKHATAVEPLSPGCTCYACTSHHRAYITHLLAAKEMLAWTLLQIHNHAVVSSFFGGIRNSIAAGTFTQDKAAFESAYAVEIGDGGATKPRLRGYHAKSGKGETRRNPPAWGALGLEGGVPETVQSPAVPEDGGEELDRKGFAENLADKPE